jgi:hypothetical protein
LTESRYAAVFFFKKLFTEAYMRKKTNCLLTLMLITSLISGCGTFATYDTGGPASHHAQRKYDEVVRKGTVVPADTGREDGK